jgi:hypothetical protein
MSTQSPTRKPSKARDPRTVALTWRSATHFVAASSDGGTLYHVRAVAGAWRCTCAGFAARRSCCHSRAAGLDRCDWCDSTETVTTYVNRNDNNSELRLCRACFTPKAVR